MEVVNLKFKFFPATLSVPVFPSLLSDVVIDVLITGTALEVYGAVKSRADLHTSLNQLT